LSQVLLGIKPEDRWIERLEQAIGGSDRWNEELARRAVVQILASPEGQLG
jgi:hypothetical protein